MSQSLHTYIVGTMVFATKRRMFVSGIARYQLIAAVSAPGSPIAPASRSAEAGKGREPNCLMPSAVACSAQSPQSGWGYHPLAGECGISKPGSRPTNTPRVSADLP
jgi:hypothetical protein